MDLCYTEHMKSSMSIVFNRVSEIERRDRELGRFLSLFAKLPPETQEKILAEVNRLKKELKDSPEEFLEKVKALAEMYSAIKKKGEDATKENSNRLLTIQLGEIESAAEELMKVKSPEKM